MKQTLHNEPFDHETYERDSWLDIATIIILFLLAGAAIGLIIALPFLIADYVWGAEAVTNWLAGV